MKKKKRKMKPVDLKKYFLYFLMYAIFGWLYEVFLEVVIYRWGYSDRGVLTGPYCPVYGVGALLFIFLIYHLIKEKPLKRKLIMIPAVFILCALSATLLELITSYICEFLMGSWPWQTYVDYKYNFQGRIALSPSLRFGLGGLLFLYILQPLFEKLLKKLGPKKVNKIFNIAVIIFSLDVIWFVLKLLLK